MDLKQIWKEKNEKISHISIIKIILQLVILLINFLLAKKNKRFAFNWIST